MASDDRPSAVPEPTDASFPVPESDEELLRQCRVETFRAGGPGGQPFGRDVQREPGRADRADPPRSQAVHDERGVAEGGGHADHGAEAGQHGALAEERAANRRRREAD